MSNGIRVDTFQESNSNIVTRLTMFLNNLDKTWVEYDHKQLSDLIELLIEQRELTGKN